MHRNGSLKLAPSIRQLQKFFVTELSPFARNPLDLGEILAKLLDIDRHTLSFEVRAMRSKHFSHKQH